MRCFYCLPEGFKGFETPENWLTFDEIERVIGAFTRLGVRRVRLTGGEPLVRKNLPNLISRLSALEGLDDLSLSTNASLLSTYAKEIKQAGVSRINVSLDTLDAAEFTKITGNGKLDQVLVGLQAAKDVGLAPLKINTVAMKGINDHQFIDLVRYCADMDFTLRFIETMPIGSTGRNASENYLDLQLVIDQLSKEFADLEEIWKAEKAQVQGSAHIKEAVEKIKFEIEEATRKGEWQKVSELQYGQLPELEAQLKQAATSESSQGDVKHKMLRTEVSSDEIAEVVSRATGIPVSKMLTGEREKLLTMESKLHERVVGQDEAVRLVSDAIRRSRSGLGDPDRPYGSFLFLGPTGVGKTELCKALAGFLFDSEDHLIRIDMSEFMEKHSVSRMIGAPPGYVGYEEGGTLTEAVRRKPYSVILLDEVEKAHPDVFNVLLQVLDDGRLTDGQGRTVDFKNTVIIMTSNLGSQMIQGMSGQDHQVVKLAVMGEVKSHFRPEFVNRIDEVVVFHSLGEGHVKTIANIQLQYLAERLNAMDMQFTISDVAVAEIASAGFDPVYGASPLKRAIQSELENPLAREILAGNFVAKDTVYVDFKAGKMTFAKA
jgi:ATP-dependent Clp protease ATP-binding subunit ClpB